MSSFSEDMTFNVPAETLRRACEMALLELDMPPTSSTRDSMVSREKLRFDAYNPVTVEISIKEGELGSHLDLTGANDGIGPYQEHHVRSKVMELLSRIQIDLDMMDDTTLQNDTGELASELEMLTNLHNNGILTDVEYHRAKETLLRKMR
jgi:hypothetical protein